MIILTWTSNIDIVQFKNPYIVPNFLMYINLSIVLVVSDNVRAYNNNNHVGLLSIRNSSTFVDFVGLPGAKGQSLCIYA